MVPKRHSHSAMAAAALLSFLQGASPALAQCEPTWLAGPDQGVAGVDGVVRAMTRWDPDGAGPSGDWLVIGGRFTIAGDTAANNIVAWDGERFHRLGGGFDSVGENGVAALTVYNGELIAGGQLYRAEGQMIPGVAAWDGVNWRPVSEAGEPVESIGGGTISALTVYNGDLIAGGRFGNISHTSAQNLARWDGAAWSAFAPGISGEVNALLAHGGDLIAGGLFSSIESMPARGVARWNGTEWTPLLGDHIVQGVLSLAEFDGSLIAGTSGGALRWTGQDWEPFGDNWHARPVYAMLPHDGGLIATGSDLMILTDDAWEPFGGANSAQAFPVYALGSLGDEVLVGGGFTQARGVRSRGLIRYTPANGGAWLAFGSGFDGTIVRAGRYNGELIVTGAFQTVAGVDALGIARWDGRTWRAFAASPPPVRVRAIAEHDGQLYLGGEYGRHSDERGSLVHLQGDAWVTLLDEPGGLVTALLSTPDGLIVAGEFSAVGPRSANVARLDAAGAWHGLGLGLNAPVTALARYDGDIFAAGSFTGSGTTLLNNIARWDGLSWQPAGDFPGGVVNALAVYQGELIAGGSLLFEGAHPLLAAGWDGETWRPLPGDNSGEYLRELAVFNNRLLSVRIHYVYGPLPHRVISEWDGSTWRFLEDQPNALVNDLTIYNGELIAVGRFTQVGDLGSAYWARYGPSLPTLCPADTDCDGALTPLDLVNYVNLWFANDPIAERTGEIPANIDVFDLLAYLDEWFTGC